MGSGNTLNKIKLSISATLLAALVVDIAEAQIGPATEDDIVEAPKGFQDILRGKSTKIDTTNGRKLQDPAATTPLAVHPSSNPQNISGTWAGGMMGAVGTLSKTKDGKRPGPRANTKVEVSRICWVGSGVNAANATIYQTERQITLVKENDLRTRRIYMNAEHPNPVTPTYGGHSVGHWQGDTLVVDTIGLKGALQEEGFDVEVGSFALIMTTPTLHVVERIKKINGGTQLEDVASFEDVATGMEPYTMTMLYKYAPNAVGLESECEDLNDKFGPNYPGEAR